MAPGCRADLVLFDEPAVPEAILHQARRRYVVKAGRVVAAEERLLTPAAPTDAG